MKTKKRILAYLLTLTLAMTSLPIQLFAQDTINTPVPMSALIDSKVTTPGAIEIKPTKYVGDGYEVEFKVTNQWPGEFQGEFILTNTSDKPLENWTLAFDFEHEITNMWNAQIVTHEANSYIIKNMGYNQDIAPGSSANIGFQANWNDDIKVPEKYDLLITKQEVQDTDYTIDFKVTGDWGQAFNGEISITNNTEETIEDWTLEFEFDRNIERFWTAEIVKHEGEHYVVKNNGYNANIAPRQTIILGFTGNPGNVDSKPANYVLNQLGQEIDYTKDTDGDGLPDGYELFHLGTDPNLKDTNQNGIQDGEDDTDEDGLSNLQEYSLGSNPIEQDTDWDGLSDYDEVNLYGTNPLFKDTDNDGLEDGDELLLGFDPLNPDTNNNGVLDGNEKIEQSFEQIINEDEKPEITNVAVSINTNGNINKTTTIKNMYKIDTLSSEVVGLIGVPVEINTTSKFNEATITFTYDESKLGDTAEEDLAIMWYNEEENWYEILDQDSTVDAENNTVSVVTNHFSTYLVVDRQDWYAVWRNTLKYDRVNSNNHDIALVIDKSGSMDGTPIANAKYAARSFVNEMYEDDKVCVIAFDSYAQMIVDLTIVGYPAKKEQIKNTINSKITAGGGTSTNAGLKTALDTLINNKGVNQQSIILLCDGDVDEPSQIIARAKSANIRIYTINFGASGTERLLKIAKETGGEYFYAKTVEQMLKAFYETHSMTVGDIDKTDTDHDGLYDTYEIVGMHLANGQIVTSDPLKPHSDTDGLSDFEEMGGINTGEQKYIGKNEKSYVTYFSGKSNPRTNDSDGDGINDDKDPEPLFKCSAYVIGDTGKIYHLDSRDLFFISNCKVFQDLTEAEKINVLAFLKENGTISDQDLSKMGYDYLSHGWIGTLLDMNYYTARANLTSEDLAYAWMQKQSEEVLQCLDFLGLTITWKQVELVISGEAYYGLKGKIPSGMQVDPSNTYYHVTTKESADKILASSELGSGSWEARVFVWKQKPTLKQSNLAGIGSKSQVVLKFQTNASFELDPGVNKSLYGLALQTTDAQKIPIKIYNMEIVDFK